MNYLPHGKWIVGRVVDFDVSKGGIILAGNEVKNITVFLLVDQIGPDVKRAKVGDVILYKVMQHVYTRDGSHQGVVLDDEENVIATVTDLDMKLVHVEGDGKRMDGTPGGPAPLNRPTA
jgi:hypothetical protein